MKPGRIDAWYLYWPMQCFILLGIAGMVIVALQPTVSTMDRLTAFGVACGVILVYICVHGQLWRISVAPEGLVARRWWRTRHIAWDKIEELEVPFIFDGNFPRMRRMRLSEGTDLLFLTTLKRIDTFNRLRQEATGKA